MICFLKENMLSSFAFVLRPVPRPPSTLCAFRLTRFPLFEHPHPFPSPPPLPSAKSEIGTRSLSLSRLIQLKVKALRRQSLAFHFGR